MSEAAPISDVPWSELDPDIAPVVRVFNALPGIRTVSSHGRAPARDGIDTEWRIGWRILSADAGRPLAQAGADGRGHLVTELLLAHAVLVSIDGFEIGRGVRVPLPFLSGRAPGECLVFEICAPLHGEMKPLTPDVYLAHLRRHWDAVGNHIAAWP